MATDVEQHLQSSLSYLQDAQQLYLSTIGGDAGKYIYDQLGESITTMGERIATAEEAIEQLNKYRDAYHKYSIHCPTDAEIDAATKKLRDTLTAYKQGKATLADVKAAEKELDDLNKRADDAANDYYDTLDEIDNTNRTSVHLRRAASPATTQRWGSPSSGRPAGASPQSSGGQPSGSGLGFGAGFADEQDDQTPLDDSDPWKTKFPTDTNFSPYGSGEHVTSAAAPAITNNSGTVSGVLVTGNSPTSTGGGVNYSPSNTTAGSDPNNMVGAGVGGFRGFSGRSYENQPATVTSDNEDQVQKKILDVPVNSLFD